MRTSWPKAAVASLAAAHAASAAPLQHRDVADWTAESYDYIIVGAGPAGIIVADRLSETGGKTLLLEQGGPSYAITGGTEAPGWLNGTGLSRVDVPGLYSTIFSTYSDTTLLCSDQYGVTNWNTINGGCTIGGSSAINAGLYFQPPASDWDTFHPAGWQSADVAAATARLYARQPAVSVTSSDGARYLQSGYDAAREWLVDGAGYAEVDLNADADNKTAVFGHTVYNYNGGQRGGPVTTYLQTALGRANFALRSNVTVRRAVRDGSTATGVVAVVDGAEVVVQLTATGRVIFSGGALFSPSLLMHSGIGPADVLATLSEAGELDAGLAPSQWINNSDVGAHLFDNPDTFIVLSSPKVDSFSFAWEPAVGDKELYLRGSRTRSGPYSFGGQTSAFFTYIEHDDGTAPSGVQGTINTAGSYEYTGNGTVTLNVYGTSGLLSEGSVVVSRNAASGRFTPGPSSGMYYSDVAGRDADDIAQFIFDIFSALDKSDSGIEPLNIAKNATKEEIKTYITTPSSYAVGPVNHWSSSCRIGKCVDNSTRVIGMDNLHVIDASILAPLSVNPQFGVMVAGERGAELIKAL